MTFQNKLVVLDRDGVLNHHSKYYIKNVKEFKLYKNSALIMSKFYKLGYKVAIATNQSAVDRKILKFKTLKKIHQILVNETKKFRGKIFHIAVCPHHPHKNCTCRKPKTGLLEEIENKSRFKFTEKWLIGDNISDLIAGNKKQFNLILVKTGLGKISLKLINENSHYDYLNFSTCEDLHEAFQLITKKINLKYL